jgi:hypothetical protein
VQYVYNNSIMSGTSSTTFEPNAVLNRAMGATIVRNLSKLGSHYALSSGSSKKFTDVSSSAWYASSVNWATAAGVMSGYGNSTFGPNDRMTREQLVCVLYNYAKKLGHAGSASASLSSYSDRRSVSSWAQTAVKWAVGAGILSGDNGKLLPTHSVTRAETAVMLNRFISYLNK